MSSDAKISAKEAGANGVGIKPSSSENKIKAKRKPRSKHKDTEAGGANVGKPAKPKSKKPKDSAPKNDSNTSKSVGENTEKSGSKIQKKKQKQKPEEAKESKKAAKERLFVEKYDKQFLRTPLLHYGTPALNLTVHRLPPGLNETDFLTQARKLSPISEKFTKLSYQQGIQPAGLLDKAMYSVATFQFPSVDIVNAVRLDLDKKEFSDPVSEGLFSCQVIKPIIGVMDEAPCNQGDDPAKAINVAIFKDFSSARAKGEVDLLQMMLKRNASPVQEQKKPAKKGEKADKGESAEKQEKSTKRKKKKSQPKATEPSSKEAPETPSSQPAEIKPENKVTDSKPKRSRRRKNHKKTSTAESKNNLPKNPEPAPT